MQNLIKTTACNIGFASGGLKSKAQHLYFFCTFVQGSTFVLLIPPERKAVARWGQFYKTPTLTSKLLTMKNYLIILSILFFNSTFGQITKIFTSDIDNFWIAYDSVQTTKDTVKQVQFIQELYLDKATDGLKDFMIAREHSAKKTFTKHFKSS